MKKNHWKVEEAVRLKTAEGLSNAEIARRLGVTRSAVWKWVNPERALEYNRRDNAKPERQAQKLAWDKAAYRDAAYRKTCPLCGGPTSDLLWGSRAVAKCKSCIQAGKEAKWRQIEEMWADGLLGREIADRLGITKGHLGVEVQRMRAARRAVPHRNRVRAPIRPT